MLLLIDALATKTVKSENIMSSFIQIVLNFKNTLLKYVLRKYKFLFKSLPLVMSASIAYVLVIFDVEAFIKR